MMVPFVKRNWFPLTVWVCRTDTTCLIWNIELEDLFMQSDPAQYLQRVLNQHQNYSKQIHNIINDVRCLPGVWAG